MHSLIYIADPMCSWCYGFVPELALLLQGLPETPLELVVGGLRAYNKQPMNASLRTSLLTHWKEVEQASGLPFSPNALSKEDFAYDTEPACRAVVAAKALAPSVVLQVFHAIQHAFYVEGQDVTQGDILARVASTALTQAGFPIDPAAFHARWSAKETIAATAEDFGQTRRWGINGFPTLVLERDGRLDLVTSGYVKAEVLIERMQALIDTES